MCAQPSRAPPGSSRGRARRLVPAVGGYWEAAGRPAMGMGRRERCLPARTDGNGPKGGQGVYGPDTAPKSASPARPCHLGGRMHGELQPLSQPQASYAAKSLPFPEYLCIYNSFCREKACFSLGVVMPNRTRCSSAVLTGAALLPSQLNIGPPMGTDAKHHRRGLQK